MLVPRALVLALVCSTLISCGGGSEGDPAPRPAEATAAVTATIASPTGTPTVAPVGGRGPKARVRRAVVAWYEAQRLQDGKATCALMTRAAQDFYVEGFANGKVDCETLFGRDGVRLFSVGAPFSAGIFRSAEVAISSGGTRAVAKALDETQTLARVRGRWLITEP